MSLKSRKNHPKPVFVPHGDKLRPLSDEQAAAWLNTLARQMPPAAIQQGRKIQAQHPGALRFRSAYYQLLCDFEMKMELIEVTQELLSRQPRDPLALSFLSHGLRLCGRLDEAIEHLEKLRKLNPDDHVVLNSLGSAYKGLGDFDRAEELLSRTTRIKPDYGVAYWNKSDISKTPEEDLGNILRQLDSLPADNPALTHYFHFSAYRLLEKLGNHEQAFSHLALGNQQKRSILEYDIAVDERIDAGIRKMFDPDFLEAQSGQGFEALQPIFIFGMPRSGTTLVEQIIASHSRVVGADELSALGDATRQIQRKYRLTGQFPDTLKDLPAGGWREIGEAYAEMTKTIRAGSTIFTDKALLNFKTAGLIKLCLPNAKLVLVERNPMDLGFGCYRQLFNQGLKFSYDFDDMARYYVSFGKLADHWQEVLGDDILRIKYEDLVSDPETWIKQLLAHCQLEEEPACFTPHETRRSVRTLSASQVREPISTKSIGRWRLYQTQLQPMQEAFAKHGVDTN